MYLYYFWRTLMNNWESSYVNIEKGTESYKIYDSHLPDTIVNNIPLEIQEVSFYTSGEGHRTSYNYYSKTSFDFTHSNRDLPIKSKLHKHDYFEMIFVASDRFEMQIESKLCHFKKWDVCILNRSTKHAEHFNPHSKIFYIVISPGYMNSWPREEGMGLSSSLIFTQFFNNNLRYSLQQNKDFITATYNNTSEIPRTFNLIQAMIEEFDNRCPGYQLIIRGLLYRLLSLLGNSSYYSPNYTDLGYDDGYSLAFSTKQLLDKHKRKVTTNEISKSLNYNAEYINTVFKKHYGLTISKYNKQVCLKQAAYLLQTTHLQIHLICKQLGFSNRTHFYNLFKEEYGCTPFKFRQNH